MQLKLIGIVLAALALFGLFMGINNLWNKARRLDVVEREYKDYRTAISDRDKRAAEAQKAAEKRSETLSMTMANVSAELDQLRSNPPKASVKYVPVEGEPCPRPRIDSDWLRVYNAASDASSLSHPN